MNQKSNLNGTTGRFGSDATLAAATMQSQLMPHLLNRTHMTKLKDVTFMGFERTLHCISYSTTINTFSQTACALLLDRQ